jgi:hypothetical protein
MAEDNPQSIDEGMSLQSVHGELTKDEPSRWERILEKFLLAAIGSIPWVGGFIVAAARIPKEEATDRKENLQTKWLEEHQKKLEQLRKTLDEISQRFKILGTEIEERIQSQEYLALVRQTFRAWDKSETDEKRRYAANLLSNAAGTRICSDDVLRLFISWIDLYHESHFAVIREIFKNPGATRFDIWTELYGALPREDSAEADLYKLLIRDLSTGGVLRQARDTNEAGQFLRKRPARHRGHAPMTVESAFEDTKPYLLTELGKQFVHYTMNEIVPRIGPVVP